MREWERYKTERRNEGGGNKGDRGLSFQSFSNAFTERTLEKKMEELNFKTFIRLV